MSARRVVDAGFEQCLADALSDPAVNLALDQHRLQHPAAIIERGIGDQTDPSGIGVDLDFGDMHPVGKRRRHVGGAPRI